MRIINKTSFDTRSLRSIFCAALRADEKVEGKLPDWQRRGLRIFVNRTKRHATWNYRVSGLATVGGTRMWLRLADNPTLVRVVWLFLHELSHTRGEHHATMSNEVLLKFAEGVVADNPGLKLRQKVEKPKPERPLREERYEHAKGMLDFYRQKIVHWEKLAAKWQRKVRYYERQAVVAAATPATGSAVGPEPTPEPTI